MVMGPDAGVHLLDGLEGVEGVVVTKAGEVVRTKAFVSLPEE